MAQQRSIEIKVGIFVLVCLVVAAVMIIRFGKYTRLAEKTYQITVVFPNVGGIVKDASVLYGGITVGKVREISLDQKGLLKVNVKLEIFEGVKIRKDAKFVINQSGLLGDRYVDVIPQSATADLLQPGDVVEGSTSVDLSEAIRSVVDVLKQAATTIERVDKAIQRIDEVALTTQSLLHVRSALANVDLTTSNAVELTASLRDMVEDNREHVDSALASFSEASENISSASRRFDEASGRVNDLIQNNQEDIRAAVKNLADSTQRLNSLLAKLEKGEGTIGKLLVDPALHDELLELVQNWRRRGILYKESTPPEGRPKDNRKRGMTPVPAEPAEPGGEQLIFGTDLTKPAP